MTTCHANNDRHRITSRIYAATHGLDAELQSNHRHFRQRRQGVSNVGEDSL